jgi:hypothetical protein
VGSFIQGYPPGHFTHFHFSPIRASRPAHMFLLNITTLATTGIRKKRWTSFKQYTDRCKHHLQQPPPLAEASLLSAPSKLLRTLEGLLKLSGEFSSRHLHTTYPSSLVSANTQSKYFKNKKHNVVYFRGGQLFKIQQPVSRPILRTEQRIHHNRWRQRLKCCGLFHFRVSFSIRRAKFILRVFSVYCKHRLCRDMSKFSHVRERTRWQAIVPQFIRSERKRFVAMAFKLYI